jgi:hypothetical protein
MASYVFYPGDGTQTDWSVPFPYLSTDHVYVSVAGVEQTITWLNSALIRITPAAPAGTALLLQRVTQKTPMTVFENTNNLTAENLTLAETQALFIAEEASDRAALSIAIDNATGQYNFQGRRAINVADPVDAQDAVTKNWAETGMSSQLTQATSQKDQAVTARIAAEAARDLAISKAAATAADSLTTAADRVQTGLDRVATAADRVQTGADRVATGQDRSTVAADKATVAADKATVAADKGTVASDRITVATDKATTQNYRDTAKTHQDNAAASAAAAAASAASVDGPNLLTKSGNLTGLADKAASRTNLGLGGSAVKDVATAAELRSNTNTGVVSVDKAWDAAAWVPLGNITGAVTIDASTGARFRATLVGNVTIDVSNLKDGAPFELAFLQDATGGRTVSWNAKFKWPSAAAPEVATTASGYAVIVTSVGAWNGDIIAAGWKVTA